MMKIFYCAYLLLAVCYAADVSWMDARKPNETTKFFFLKTFLHDASAAFKEFKSQYKRVYESTMEEEKRFIAFVENFVFVKKMTALYEGGKMTYKVGINRFSDMNETERKSFRGYRPELRKPLFSYSRGATFLGSAVNLTLPHSIDWRQKNAVTDVKDQGNCGSCYAFSSTGSLEGQHSRKFGRLISLSEQQIIDCSTGYGNQGCNGGIMDNSFRYIKDNDGIDTESYYPYVSGTTGRGSMYCHYNASAKGAEDVGYVNIVPSGDEEKLKEAVANVGPISVAIDASQSGFMQYTGGIYEDDYCSNAAGSLDHAVLVVGYGTEEGTPYWLVKNSWATSWGLDGYIKMRRNSDNMCGIATMACYPLV